MSSLQNTDKLSGGTAVRKGFRYNIARNKTAYLLILPAMIVVFFMSYLPFAGVIMAFKDYDIIKGILGSPWVGLKYFEEFFSSIYFGRVMKNTLIISFYDMLVGFPLPIIFSLLINELRSTKLKRFVQTATYLPHFISMVVICGIITDFFSSNGIITNLISYFGGSKINYVGSNEHFRHIYVWTNLWQGFGWSSIVYISALTGIDQQLYEAATIDGAG